MNNINVKMADTGSYQAAGTAKSTNNTREVTDDFKNLLQGKQESSKDSKETREVSKKDTKQEKKDAISDDSNTNVVKEDSEHMETESLLAAYQMSQGWKPEMFNPEPELTVEAPVIDTAVIQEVMEETELSLEPQVQTAETDNQQMQVQMAEVEETIPQVQAVPVREGEVQQQTTVEATAVQDQKQQTQEVSEVSVKASDIQPKETKVSDAKEEVKAQTENHRSEHAAATLTQASIRVEAEVKEPQEVVRMQVPQTEELPDKVTDELLAKMSEGVKEFEIHIEPENLGKIAVKILYQDGQATVSILCSEKKALDVLGQNAREIGNMIERNLGGTTTIIVEKQETQDYLNQTKEENEKQKQNEEKEQQKKDDENQDAEDAEQFLQKLRLGLAG